MITKTTKTKSVSTAESLKKQRHYIEAVGRRKTSVARVRLFDAVKGSIIVNGKDFLMYFPTVSLQRTIQEPLKETKLLQKVGIEVKVMGGGISSQSGAVRHGIARVLEKFQPALRKPLKHLGFLKRDSRMKERRKFGLKKARKAPQWSKR